jgi:hypothetical protein
VKDHERAGVRDRRRPETSVADTSRKNAADGVGTDGGSWIAPQSRGMPQATRRPNAADGVGWDGVGVMGSARRLAWEVPPSRGGTELTKRSVLAYLGPKAPRGRERVLEGPTGAEDGTHDPHAIPPDAMRLNAIIHPRDNPAAISGATNSQRRTAPQPLAAQPPTNPYAARLRYNASNRPRYFVNALRRFTFNECVSKSFCVVNCSLSSTKSRICS